MTVMFATFFGIPQEVIRLGKLKELSGVAVKLYAALCYQSERWCTRELKLTTAQLRDLVGGAPNSHAKARDELRKAGLVEFRQQGADGFVFHLCNPETGKPWPIDPKERVPYRRKSASQSTSSAESSVPIDWETPSRVPITLLQGSHAKNVPISTASNSEKIRNEDLESGAPGIEFPYGANDLESYSPFQKSVDGDW